MAEVAYFVNGTKERTSTLVTNCILS